ncbi:hypothetical protein [Lyngbya sp. CCY1209]|uniref:hypothetical protein n=1 Tax=Lyngbya sp. CCY1209 TaxID=2886103 RepID=UPI002D20F348|nr:hypothetical protein [Lyngbya sp. CCY1209]MEB3886026.1 hypothetical protein [Lyngbya sp. CCY1209]
MASREGGKIRPPGLGPFYWGGGAEEAEEAEEDNKFSLTFGGRCARVDITQAIYRTTEPDPCLLNLKITFIFGLEWFTWSESSSAWKLQVNRSIRSAVFLLI